MWFSGRAAPPSSTQLRVPHITSHHITWQRNSEYHRQNRLDAVFEFPLSPRNQVALKLNMLGFKNRKFKMDESRCSSCTSATAQCVECSEVLSHNAVYTSSCLEVANKRNSLIFRSPVKTQDSKM